MADEPDWGPIPDLVRRLPPALFPLPSRRLVASPAAARFGGPWGVSTRGGWRPPFAPPSAPPPAGHDDLPDLTDALLQVHAWLEDRNRRHLLPRLSPLTHHVPDALVGVTHAGVAAVVAGYEATHGHPTALVADLPPGGPGDQLAVHLTAEAVVRGADGRVRPLRRRGRPAGGFRDPTFLQLYPALTASPPRSRERRLAAVVDSLLARSCFSRLVYPDLPGPTPTPAVVNAFWQGPFGVRGGEIGTDVWFSHLARSVVAGLLAPPPLAEQAWADTALRRARRARAARGGVGGWLAWLAERRMPNAGRPAVGVEAGYAGRLQRLTALLPRADSCSAARFVHTRVLDMLARHLLVGVGRDLAGWMGREGERFNVWRRVNQPSPEDERTRLREVAAEGRARVGRQPLERVVRVLLGPRADVTRVAALSDEQRAAVFAFLNPSDLPQHTPGLGLDAADWEELRRRYTSATEHPVRWPNPTLLELAPEPVCRLVGRWLEALQAAVPPPPAVEEPAVSPE